MPCLTDYPDNLIYDCCDLYSGVPEIDWTHMGDLCRHLAPVADDDLSILGAFRTLRVARSSVSGYHLSLLETPSEEKLLEIFRHQDNAEEVAGWLAGWPYLLYKGLGRGDDIEAHRLLGFADRLAAVEVYNEHVEDWQETLASIEVPEKLSP